MKTTLEIPDAIFRRAKAKAAEQGIPFREFVTHAVIEQLSARPAKNGKAIADLAGELHDLHEETARINALIEEEFEKIEPEDWL